MPMSNVNMVPGKPTRLIGPVNMDSQKHITIKKILSDLQNDVKQVEEENIDIIREMAD